MNLLVTYGKKEKQTIDMGGFPDTVLVDDKTKIVVVQDPKPRDLDFTFEYQTIPELTVFAHAELTQKQIDESLIDHFWQLYKRDNL